MLPSLKDLSDTSLLDNVKNFRQIENLTVADLVLYLSEVDVRKIYRDIGFSSLFSYCTNSLEDGGLGYSEGSAYRRIQAARSLKDNPEIYELLRDGKLSLCAVSEISRVINPGNKTELLELSQGKPKAEVQKITVKYQAPSVPLKKEKVTVKKVIIENKDPLFSAPETPQIQEETRFTFTVEVDLEFMELLTEAKNLVGFLPNSQVIKRTLKEFIHRRKAAPRIVKPKAERQGKVDSSKVFTEAAKASNKPKSRYIPKAVANRVRERDQHRCTFISPSGKRCSETCGLQMDHIQPFALGGTNEASNLRLLCPAHNQLHAEAFFAKEKIESYFQKASQ